MKKLIKISGLVAACFLAVGISPAFADAVDIPVMAEVIPVCHIVSSGSLNFGQLDPDNAVDTTASTDVGYWCTKGSQGNITLDDGVYYSGGTKHVISSDNGSEYMPYTVDPIASTTPTMNGPVSPETLTITGHIRGADYANSWVGNYTDILVIDITSNYVPPA